MDLCRNFNAILFIDSTWKEDHDENKIRIGEKAFDFNRHGEVEPAIAEADRALTSGSSETLVKLVTDTVSQGIRQRYETVAEALKHKDESVQKGREYVAAYVEYTHYVERLQKDAEGHAAHSGEAVQKNHAAPLHGHGHQQM